MVKNNQEENLNLKKSPRYDPIASKNTINQAIPGLTRAFLLLGRVEIKGSTALVGSDSDRSTKYTVDMIKNSCTCKDHYFRKVECKHMKAVQLYQKITKVEVDN